ncbi:MAG: NADH-quinone oxidoreductase, chain [Peptococcaceae bacterium]|jgi:NADH-quinone oxidoreductase subunit I|nr:NADH-quinone oxidoreductase, chain [Peptococcaceae bacterium]
MYGSGVVKGLALTLKKFFSKKITEQYPEERPFIDHRWRGSLQLDKDACICCNMCVNACPNGVITLESGKDENNKRFLTRYEVNFERCLVCGLCVEACPKQCLKFTREYELATYFRDDVKLGLYHNPKLSAPSSTYAQKTEQKKEG